MTHLWEVEHPYYCEEQNYHVAPRDGGGYLSFDSWDEFMIRGWGDADLDMNLLFRWDWKHSDPDLYEVGEEVPPDALVLFWVLQRKGDFRCVEVFVTEADEPAIRKWLSARAAHLAKLWNPIEVT